MKVLLLSIAVLFGCKTRSLEHLQVDDSHFKVTAVNPNDCDTAPAQPCDNREGLSFDLLAWKLCKGKQHQISHCGFEEGSKGSIYSCTATCLKSSLEKNEVGQGIFDVIMTNPQECNPRETDQNCVQTLRPRVEEIAGELCGADQIQDVNVTMDHPLDGWRYVWRITCVSKAQVTDLPPNNPQGDHGPKSDKLENQWKLSLKYDYQVLDWIKDLNVDPAQIRAESPSVLQKKIDMAIGSFPLENSQLLATSNGKSWYRGWAYGIPAAEREVDQCILRYGEGHEQIHRTTLDKKNKPLDVKYYCKADRDHSLQEQPAIFKSWVATERAAQGAPPSVRRSLTAKADALKKKIMEDVTRRSASFCAQKSSVVNLIVQMYAETEELSVRYSCYEPILKIDEFCAGGKLARSNSFVWVTSNKQYAAGSFTCEVELKCYAGSVQMSKAEEKQFKKKTSFDADGICVICPESTKFDPRETLLDESDGATIYCAKK